MNSRDQRLQPHERIQPIRLTQSSGDTGPQYGRVISINDQPHICGPRVTQQPGRDLRGIESLESIFFPDLFDIYPDLYRDVERYMRTAGKRT